jgi:hypothetical protein
MFPHPIRAPEGHMYGAPELKIAAEDATAVRATHHWAIDLFNNGYYWEAHEAWEALWHAFGRNGKKADFIKGLIKLAAAGVKAREGNAVGVKRHARRAGELFQGLRDDTGLDGPMEFGLDAEWLMEQSKIVDSQADKLMSTSHNIVVRLMPFVL